MSMMMARTAAVIPTTRTAARCPASHPVAFRALPVVIGGLLKFGGQARDRVVAHHMPRAADLPERDMQPVAGIGEQVPVLVVGAQLVHAQRLLTTHRRHPDR